MSADPEGLEGMPQLLAAIRAAVRRPWRIMEVCGGQTHAIVRHGLDQLLPPELELLHGPGCPVCVTPLELIDRAQAIAMRPEVILCSFGDMLRVPGSRGDLLACKARGADVRVVYAPLDAFKLALRHPDRQVVFFAVGFETTAPANAIAIEAARRAGCSNFSILSSQVLVPPALAAILEDGDARVQGFIGPGHVCTVMGTGQYEEVSRRFNVPIAVAGFGPRELLMGVLCLVRLLERGEVKVENAYGRAVKADGNPSARDLVERTFRVCDRKWRGIGTIPESGLALRDELHQFDAERRFQVASIESTESPHCIAGEILRGLKKPPDCAQLGRACTPETPLGATMVSAEGACAAYHRYRLIEAEASTERSAS